MARPSKQVSSFSSSSLSVSACFPGSDCLSSYEASCSLPVLHLLIAGGAKKAAPAAAAPAPAAAAPTPPPPPPAAAAAAPPPPPPPAAAAAPPPVPPPPQAPMSAIPVAAIRHAQVGKFSSKFL